MFIHDLSVSPVRHDWANHCYNTPRIAYRRWFNNNTLAPNVWSVLIDRLLQTTTDTPDKGLAK